MSYFHAYFCLRRVWLVRWRNVGREWKKWNVIGSRRRGIRKLEWTLIWRKRGKGHLWSLCLYNDQATVHRMHGWHRTCGLTEPFVRWDTRQQIRMTWPEIDFLSAWTRHHSPWKVRQPWERDKDKKMVLNFKSIDLSRVFLFRILFRPLNKKLR